MMFYKIEPEVSGGMGEGTVIDSSVHPPIVTCLHYCFDDWLGDSLIESFPCFLVTAEAASKIEQAKLTGADFKNARISTSEVFDELNPGQTLPKFLWLDLYGAPGDDDLGIAADGRLVLSEQALAVFMELGIQHAIVSPFSATE